MCVLSVRVCVYARMRWFYVYARKRCLRGSVSVCAATSYSYTMRMKVCVEASVYVSDVFVCARVWFVCVIYVYAYVCMYMYMYVYVYVYVYAYVHMYVYVYVYVHVYVYVYVNVHVYVHVHVYVYVYMCVYVHERARASACVSNAVVSTCVLMLMFATLCNVPIRCVHKCVYAMYDDVT